MDIHVCGYTSSIIHACMDINSDILGFLWISMHLIAMDSQSWVATGKIACAPSVRKIGLRSVIVTLRKTNLIYPRSN